MFLDLLSLSLSVSEDELLEDELLELEQELLELELLELSEHELLVNEFKQDDVSDFSPSELELLEHLLRLLDDEFLDEPLNLQRRPLECPRSPLPLYPPYPLSSYHSRIFKTLFSLAVTFSSSRSLFLSSVSTVPITS